MAWIWLSSGCRPAAAASRSSVRSLSGSVRLEPTDSQAVQVRLDGVHVAAHRGRDGTEHPKHDFTVTRHEVHTTQAVLLGLLREPDGEAHEQRR